MDTNLCSGFAGYRTAEVPAAAAAEAGVRSAVLPPERLLLRQLRLPKPPCADAVPSPGATSGSVLG